MKLYNFEEHGDRYFVVNTKKKNILHWTGVKENITKDNLDLVKFCIEGNVKILESKISTMYLRLNQTERKITMINGGHSISEPLSDNQKITYKEKLDKHSRKLEKIKRINLTELIS